MSLIKTISASVYASTVVAHWLTPLYFEAELGKALLLTEKKSPPCFNRFAKRVLGANYSAEAKAGLKKSTQTIGAQHFAAAKIRETKHIYPIELGLWPRRCAERYWQPGIC